MRVFNRVPASIRRSVQLLPYERRRIVQVVLFSGARAAFPPPSSCLAVRGQFIVALSITGAHKRLFFTGFPPPPSLTCSYLRAVLERVTVTDIIHAVLPGLARQFLRVRNGLAQVFVTSGRVRLEDRFD